MATVKHREKNKTDLPTQLKVANRSIFLAEGSPARCVSERKKGGNPRTGKVQGRSPWRAFGDFPRDGKVTRGGGAERPPHRGVQRGHRPLAKKFPPLDERNISFLHRLEAVVQKAVEDDAAFWVKQEEPSPFRDGGQLGELVIQAVELVLFAAGSKGLFLPALQRGGVPVAVAAALAGFYTVLFLKIEVEQVAAGLPGQVVPSM